MKRLLAIGLLSCLAIPSLPVAMCLVVGASLVVPAVAMAADEAEHHAEDGHDHDGEEAADHDSDDPGGEAHAETPLLSFDVGSAVWNLVIFGCVMAVLSVFVWPNVLGGLQGREERIREDLEAASKANEEAQSILAGYQSKLDEASVQVQSMLAEARRDAEASGQKIVEQAKQEAAAQRDRAVADIDNAKKVAMAELAGQTSNMAMQVASSVVGRELSADNHADLIQQAMERLPSQN